MWANAAERIAAETGLTIHALRVDEPTDPAGAWARVSELEEGGALLVRPDGHVGYRSKETVKDPQGALAEALATILSGGDASARAADGPGTHGLRQLATALVPGLREP